MISNIKNSLPEPARAHIQKGAAAAASAAVRRVVSQISPFLGSKSSAPSVNVNVVKLEECEEEFDMTKREAKFAFRSTDLGSWNSSSSFAGEENTDSDPTEIQHWALVVHFPRANKTFLFEAGQDENGLLEAGRAENVDYEVFEKATNFGTVETSPNELLTIAKKVIYYESYIETFGIHSCELFEEAKVSSSEELPYNLIFNNCQTWVTTFLHLISPELLLALHVAVPATEIRWHQDYLPPIIFPTVKLQECEEEFDETPREAKFALRSTEYWALVVHFPICNKTYLFDTWKDENCRLQAGRTENVFVNKEVFEKATHFDTIQTSPWELLEKAKQVPTGKYDAYLNNRATWLRDFLLLISPKLLQALYKEVPETRWVIEHMVERRCSNSP